MTGTEDEIAAQLKLRERFWYEELAKAEKIDAQFGLYLPGDSALAVVLNSLHEAAYS